MEKFQIPGISIALVDNYSLVRTICLGHASKNKIVTPDTIFQAASISKSVAALVTLSFVAKGKLDLDNDISQYLKGWMIALHKSLTLRQLLSHSSGLNVPGFSGYSERSRIPTVIQILYGIKPANSPAIKKEFKSGVYRYSGGGYVVLQKLLEDISGRSLFDLANNKVFSKLRMDASTYSLLRIGNRKNIAAGHDSSRHIIPGQWNLYPESAAAGLWTTPSDLAKFVIEIQKVLVDRSRIIPKDLAMEMLKFQVKVPYRKPFTHLGLGVLLYKYRGHIYFGHGGANLGYRSRFIATDNGKAIIIMTNSDSGFKLINKILPMLANELMWPSFPKGNWI